MPHYLLAKSNLGCYSTFDYIRISLVYLFICQVNCFYILQKSTLLNENKSLNPNPNPNYIYYHNHIYNAYTCTTPGRRIVDDDRLPQLLQYSEIVWKKSFRLVASKKKIGNSR